MEDKIYFISGLGADKRVFVHLRIDAPFQHHLEWIPPEKNESIAAYSRRLLSQIDLNANIILIGVSFGGIIAQEIAKIVPVKKVILISSIKNEKEMDWKLKCVKMVGLHQLFPASVLKFLNRLTADYYFGISSKEESKLLQRIIADTDPVFMTWAIDRIMKWTNNISIPLLHLHGSKDRIFPIKSIQDKTVVADGGHFMILNKANEISMLINLYLKQPGH